MRCIFGALFVILLSLDLQAGESPFRFTTNADFFGGTEIHDSDSHNGDTVRYRNMESRFTMAFWYNPCTKEALAATIGYSYAHLDWNDNPDFNQRDFYTAHIALDGLSYRMCDWKWISRVMMNIDAEQWDLNHYLTWDLLLWGTYEYCDSVNIHTGFIVRTGMKVDNVYPIVGFEWAINECWEWNMVFPCDISLIYTYDCNWSAKLEYRMFNERYRVGAGEERSRAVWTHQTSGLELGVLYDWNDCVTAGVHAGYTCGGRIKIANKHYMHRNRYRLESAPYLGGEICASF